MLTWLALLVWHDALFGGRIVKKDVYLSSPSPQRAPISEVLV
jgi:hypothetical protein